jgi:hypothetical protein
MMNPASGTKLCLLVCQAHSRQQGIQCILFTNGKGIHTHTNMATLVKVLTVDPGRLM